MNDHDDGRDLPEERRAVLLAARRLAEEAPDAWWPPPPTRSVPDWPSARTPCAKPPSPPGMRASCQKVTAEDSGVSSVIVPRWIEADA
ncbi:hypothetical protein [Streptomyces sp. WM6378]|uniref:hypothetical protein n=1 Tax=Streptomyces sp. WM6378 TaxID=1415557 RepID=UPI0006B02BC2|nr:hypothetical protein [Streptomyces sp. WM6378]KOU53554.1 hypothetical protein ADK54_04185 [Streptomyces sp. WM6378]